MLITGVDMSKGVKNLIDSKRHPLVKVCEYVQTMVIGL